MTVTVTMTLNALEALYVGKTIVVVTPQATLTAAPKAQLKTQTVLLTSLRIKKEAEACLHHVRQAQ